MIWRYEEAIRRAGKIKEGMQYKQLCMCMRVCAYARFSCKVKNWQMAYIQRKTRCISVVCWEQNSFNYGQNFHGFYERFSCFSGVRWCFSNSSPDKKTAIFTTKLFVSLNFHCCPVMNNTDPPRESDGPLAYPKHSHDIAPDSLTLPNFVCLAAFSFSSVCPAGWEMTTRSYDKPASPFSFFKHIFASPSWSDYWPTVVRYVVAFYWGISFDCYLSLIWASKWPSS